MTTREWPGRQNCWFPKIQIPLKHPFWYYFHYTSIFCLIHPGVWLRPLLREKHHSSPPRRRNQGRAGEVCTTCFHQIQRVVSSEMIPSRLIFSICLRNRDRCREAVQEAQCMSMMHSYLYRYKNISCTINTSNVIIFPNRSNIIQFMGIWPNPRRVIEATADKATKGAITLDELRKVYLMPQNNEHRLWNLGSVENGQKIKLLVS